MKKLLVVLLLPLTLASAQIKEDFFEDVIQSLNQSEGFSSSKNEIKALIEVILEKGSVSSSDTDAKKRPAYVGLQGLIENMMSQYLVDGKIVDLLGVIHTPMPTTPFCTEMMINEHLVAEEIETDEKRLFTVTSRAHIVRKYLERGGKLYVAYPEDGFKKRTEEQQEIYLAELARYPENLFDCQLAQDLPNIHIPVQELGFWPGGPQTFRLRRASVFIDTEREAEGKFEE